MVIRQKKIVTLNGLFLRNKGSVLVNDFWDIEKLNILVIISYKEINVNQSINIHIKHGEVRYACANCEYAATQAGDLRRHRKRKHNS